MEDHKNKAEQEYDELYLICDELKVSKISTEKVERLIFVLRDLRLLATDKDYQDILGEKMRNNLADLFLKLAALAEILKDEEKIWLFFFQMITNVITNNTKNKIIIISKYLSLDPIIFLSFLKKFEKNQKIIKVLAIFTYNLPFLLDEQEKIAVYSSPNFLALLKMVFDHFFDYEIKVEASSDQNDLLEWIYLLICQIFNLEFLNAFDFFHSLLSREAENTQLNAYHIKFFILIYHLASKIIENREQTSIIKEVNDSFKKDGSSDFLESSTINKFGEFFIKKSDFCRIIDWFNLSVEDFIKDIDSELNSKEKISHQLNFLNIIIKIFAVATHCGNYVPDIQIMVYQKGVFSSVLKLLKLVGTLINQKTPESPSANKFENLFEAECKYELITMMIRFISNVVHLYKEAQDFILKENYLYVVLGFTHLDEKNPLMKEWTIVLIRNLTEINPEIQKKIADLKLIDLDEKSKEILKKFKKEENF